VQQRKRITLSAAYCLAVLAAILTGCSTASPHMSAHSHTNQTPHSFTFKQTRAEKINYLLHLPKNYDAKSSETFPLILFLHGAGERGTDLWKVATHGPSHVVTTNADFPFIIVSPQCPEGQHWDTESLLALLADIKKRYAVDKKRVYLTGLSMGGYGTWDLGLSHPEEFAAMVPICGGGEFISAFLASHDPIKGPALRSLGIWAFHGAKDPVVPVAETQRMVDLVKNIGVKDVKLTIYPEAQHNSWTETYNNPELYKWLLAHHR
jgi:predicted peptidase